MARAPGRLDVMGGIADYSGAQVLQMPIAEAAHVAVQRHPVEKQRLWKHMQARQAASGSQNLTQPPWDSNVWCTMSGLIFSCGMLRVLE